MANTPNIRFKGFTGDWGNTKFSDLVSIRRGLTYSPANVTQKGIRVLRSSNICDGIFRLFDDDVFVAANAVNIPVAKNGDILITAANGSKNLVGKHAILHDIERPVVHGGFMLLAEGDETSFVNSLMSSKWYSHFIALTSSGGGGSIGNLNKEDLENEYVKIPLTKQERDVIAQYCSLLETTISQREKELEKLKNIKRALLEKLFPQNGQTVPAIRFKGFNGEWGEKIMGDVFTSFEERNHPELPVLAATQDRGMVIREDIGYSIAHNRSNEVTYKRVLPGQFVIHLRSFQGGFAHSNVEGITSPAYDIFGFKEPQAHNDYYWKYLFSSAWFIKCLGKVTYGIRDGRNISYDEFLELTYRVPLKTEQTKIAELLKTLSNLLSLRERQLTLLKHTKQALLEQMFVNE